MDTLIDIDYELGQILELEDKRQHSTINLIASENYPHPAIRLLAGSCLSTKYAEGYPGARYYGGCRKIDQIELLAIERAKKLFGAEHANVQPLSGTQANLAVYAAFLQPGDCVLAMDLRAGGHLSHGARSHISGQLYKFVFYGVDRITELLDYDEITRLAYEHQPRLIIAGASAYARAIDFERFAAIAADVEALLLVDMAHIAGLVAAGLHQNPVSYADVVTSTTQKTLRGPRGGFILCKKRHAAVIDRAVMPGLQASTNMGIVAAKALTFACALQPDFKEYQQQVCTSAQTMANALMALGQRVVSGGTDTHLLTIDVGALGIDGAYAQDVLEAAGVITNRNLIPFDTRIARVASGVRIGTAAVTTLGLTTQQADIVAHLIHCVLTDSSEKTIKNVREQAGALAQSLCYSTF